jgi:hypothetical protein
MAKVYDTGVGLRRLRNRRAKSYYFVVKHFGSVAFSKGKEL